MTTVNTLPPATAALPAVAGASLAPTQSPRDQVMSALIALTTAISSVNAAAAAVDFPLFKEVTTALLDEVSFAQDAVADAVAALLTATPAQPTYVTTPPVPGTIRYTGPWLAGHLFGVIPLAPLTAVPDHNEKWFAITRSKYIGLTKNSAISLNAVTGISTALSDRLNSQVEAIEYFNEALRAGAVVLIA